MKITPLILASVTAATLTTPAFAANGDNKGKPFQELSALIEENKTLIAENSASIDALSGEVQSLALTIAQTQNDLAAVTARVLDNEASITELMTRVDAAETDIDTLQSELAEAVLATANLRTDLENQIALLDASLRSMIGDNAALITQLNDMIADLQTQVDANTAAINPLSTQVSALLATVMANSNNIALLQADRNALTTAVDGLTNQVSDLSTEIEALKTRTSRLESFHADLYLGDSISGTLNTSDEFSLVRDCNVNTSSGYQYGDCHADFYTLYVPDTRTVTINLGSPTLDTSTYGSGNFFDTYLFLHPEGQPDINLAANDDAGYRLNSMISVTLDAGVYIIEVSAFRMYQIGENEYELSVQ